MNQEQRLSLNKDMSEDQIYRAVVDIVKWIGTSKIHLAMEHLNWEWYTLGAVPEPAQIFDAFVERGVEAVKSVIRNGDNVRMSSGGIEAVACMQENGDIYLSLRFVLEEWDNYL